MAATERSASRLDTGGCPWSAARRLTSRASMAVATSPRMFSGTSSNISIMAEGILIADAFCGKVTKGDGRKCAMVSQREC